MSDGLGARRTLPIHLLVCVHDPGESGVDLDAPRALRYMWRGDQDSDDVTEVTYLLEETGSGTRFTWRHTGFRGVGGFTMSKLLGNVRRKMLTEGVPPVLEAYHRARR